MWHIVYEESTGKLVSVGQVVASELPEGLVSVEFGQSRPADNQMWDEATKAFIARPAKVLIDRLQDILDHPAYGDSVQLLWNSLNATQRTRLRNGLIKLLGKYRWRNIADTINLDGTPD